MISITYEFGSNRRSDPTGALDWVIFIWCLFVSIAQTISVIIYYVKRRNYAPLRTKNFQYLYFCYVFGLIMIWSTFVSNSHFDEWNRDFKGKSCVFWTWWMQYLFGFAFWYLFIVQHIIGIAFKHIDYKKRLLIRFIIFLFTIACPLTICIAITNDGEAASYFDSYLNTCNSILVWKITLIVWIGLCIILIIALTFLLHRNTVSTLSNEYQSLKWIIFVAFVIFIINIPINIFGILQFRWGRCIYTFGIAFLHFYIHFKLIGYRLVKALKNDEEYKHAILLDNTEVDQIDINTIVDLEQNKKLMEGFILYLKNLDTSTQFSVKNGNNNNNASKEYVELANVHRNQKALNYANAYEQIVRILDLQEEKMKLELKKYNDDSSQYPLRSQINFALNDLYVRHIADNSVSHITITDEKLLGLLHNCLNVNPDHRTMLAVKKDLLKTMDSLWGKTYLKFDSLQLDKYYRTRTGITFEESVLDNTKLES